MVSYKAIDTALTPVTAMTRAVTVPTFVIRSLRLNLASASN